MPRNHRSADISAAVVGVVLRKAREQKQISQHDVALRADMDRAYISEVENGKRSLSVDRLLRLCRAMDIKAEEIISEIEKQIKRSVR